MTVKEKDQLFLMLKEVGEYSVSDEQLKSRIEEYAQITSNEELMIEVGKDIYKMYGSDSDKFDYYLEYIRGFDSFKTFSLDDYKRMIVTSLLNNVKSGNMTIEQNHQLLNLTLRQICKLLNENSIDYYLAGALPCYIITNNPLRRYHDDIDILLNEEDIDKVKQLLIDTDFIFQDKRFESPKYFDIEENRPIGEHEVIAQHKASEFHLGFFCFRRGSNNEVITREYYKNQNVTKVFERIITPSLSVLMFDEQKVLFEDTYFRMESLESIYKIKKYTMHSLGREKDITDVTMIEQSGKLDHNKLEQLNNLGKDRFTQIVNG